MIIKNAKVFLAEGKFVEKDIYVKDGVIADAPAADDKEVIDAAGCYAIPGLTDIHFHGCMGKDFCDGEEESIYTMAKYEAGIGVTTICPATMTLSKEDLMKIMGAAKQFKAKQNAGDESLKGCAKLVGINMEGPFISMAKKGAQNGKYVINCNVELFDELNKESGNLVKLIDVAPEEPGAMEFIKARKDDVVISIAHTCADYDTAKEAIDNGACHMTHLYNAMNPFTHRAPGPIAAAVDNDKVNAELICDGIHIHGVVVRTTLKAFTDDRIIFISDSMMATGLDDGDYALGGQPVKVVGNLATLKDGTLAGSATNLMDCVRVAVQQMNVPLESAIKCAAVNSAKAIGIYDKYGSIDAGKVANIVLLNQKDLTLNKVIMDGKELSK